MPRKYVRVKLLYRDLIGSPNLKALIQSRANLSSKYFVVRRKVTWSKEQMIEFVRRRGIKTRSQLRAATKSDSTVPYFINFLRVFGNWITLRDEAWGKGPAEPPRTREYVIKCAVEYGLMSRSKFKAARRLRPDVIPSAAWVLRHWGDWSSFKRDVLAASANVNINAYLELADALGRFPTEAECREVGIEMSHIMKLFFSKSNLDDYLSRLSQSIYQQRRSREKRRRGDGSISGHEVQKTEGAQAEVPEPTAS